MSKSKALRIILKILRRTPPGSRRTVWINRLGLNVLRCCYFNFKQLIRTPVIRKNDNYEHYVVDLKKQGFVKIENYLSDEDFDRIAEEYSAEYENFFMQDNFEKTILKSFNCSRVTENITKEDTKTWPVDHLNNSEILKYVIQRATKKKIFIPIKGFYREQSLKTYTTKYSHVLFTREPHYDHCYHSYNVMLYINDVSQDNGCIHYLPESHKFNFKRLLLEYSCSNSLSYENRLILNNVNTNNALSNDFHPLIGKKNTLVIFDTMGIHKRGDFSSLIPRKLISLSFNGVESLWNTRIGYWLSKKVSVQ